MRISQDIRDYAKDKELSEWDAIQEGMKEKAEEFVNQGSKLYK